MGDPPLTGRSARSMNELMNRHGCSIADLMVQCANVASRLSRGMEPSRAEFQRVAFFCSEVQNTWGSLSFGLASLLPGSMLPVPAPRIPEMAALGDIDHEPRRAITANPDRFVPTNERDLFEQQNSMSEMAAMNRDAGGIKEEEEVEETPEERAKRLELEEKRRHDQLQDEMHEFIESVKIEDPDDGYEGVLNSKVTEAYVVPDDDEDHMAINDLYDLKAKRQREMAKPPPGLRHEAYNTQSSTSEDDEPGPSRPRPKKSKTKKAAGKSPPKKKGLSSKKASSQNETENMSDDDNVPLSTLLDEVHATQNKEVKVVRQSLRKALEISKTNDDQKRTTRKSNSSKKARLSKKPSNDDNDASGEEEAEERKTARKTPKAKRVAENDAAEDNETPSKKAKGGARKKAKSDKSSKDESRSKASKRGSKRTDKGKKGGKSKDSQAEDGERKTEKGKPWSRTMERKTPIHILERRKEEYHKKKLAKENALANGSAHKEAKQNEVKQKQQEELERQAEAIASKNSKIFPKPPFSQGSSTITAAQEQYLVSTLPLPQAAAHVGSSGGNINAGGLILSPRQKHQTSTRQTAFANEHADVDALVQTKKTPPHILANKKEYYQTHKDVILKKQRDYKKKLSLKKKEAASQDSEEQEEPQDNGGQQRDESNSPQSTATNSERAENRKSQHMMPKKSWTENFLDVKNGDVVPVQIVNTIELTPVETVELEGPVEQYELVPTNSGSQVPENTSDSREIRPVEVKISSGDSSSQKAEGETRGIAIKVANRPVSARLRVQPDLYMDEKPDSPPNESSDKPATIGSTNGRTTPQNQNEEKPRGPMFKKKFLHSWREHSQVNGPNENSPGAPSSEEQPSHKEPYTSTNTTSTESDKL